jgi:hypothetical protein
LSQSGAFLERLPPPAIIAIPLNNVRQTLAELNLRGVAKFRVDLADVNAVATVVAFPVGNFVHEGAIATCGLEEQVGELGVGELSSTPNVVYLTGFAALENKRYPAAMVVNVEPVANILAITIEGHLKPIEQVGHKERNDLLGKVVGPVVVAAPGYGSVQTVGYVVAPNQ